MQNIWDKMYEAAKAVLNERRISDYVTCGEVAAAVLSKSGKIYTGVCVDTCSTLGICAERNLLFHHQALSPDDRIVKLAIASDPSLRECYPCGICRQVLVDVEKRQGRPIRVIMSGAGTATAVDSTKDLLPFTFEL